MKKKYLLLLIITYSLLIISNTQNTNAAYWLVNFTHLNTSSTAALPGSLDGTNYIFRNISSNNLIFINSVNDDAISIYNFSDKTKNPQILGNYTDNAPPLSIDGPGGFRVDQVRGVAYVCSTVDDAFTVLNISIPSMTYGLSSYNRSAVPYSTDGCNDAEYFDIGGTRFVAVASLTDDQVVIFNITDSSNIRNSSNWTASGNPCSVDGVRYLQYSYTYGVLFAVSSVDGVISALNISPDGNIRCVSNFTTGVANTGLRDFYYDDYSRLIYLSNISATGPSVPAEYLVLNFSTFQFKLVTKAQQNFLNYANGSIYNTYDIITTNVSTDNYAFYLSSGNGTVPPYGFVTVFNITVPWSPVNLGSFNVSNTTGACKWNSTESLAIYNDTIYVGSSGSSCLMAMRWRDLYEPPPRTSTNWNIYGGSTSFSNFSADMIEDFYYQYAQNQSNLTIYPSNTNCGAISDYWGNSTACLPPVIGNRSDFGDLGTNKRLWIHPINSTDGALIKFVVPVTAEYKFNTSFWKWTGGNNVDFYIKINGTNGILLNNSNLSGSQNYTIELAQNLTCGDTIDWYVLTTDSNAGDSSGVTINISANTTARGCTPAVSTCTYTSGDWNVNLGDNCVITSSVDVGANKVVLTGTGSFTIDNNGVVTAKRIEYKPTGFTGTNKFIIKPGGKLNVKP